MNRSMGEILLMEEIKRIIIKEKGKSFWEEFMKDLEQSEREHFIDGYKYAISVLEDGLVEE